jgi:polysaccharide pyruvyl transferase WcaK-like protein
MSSLRVKMKNIGYFGEVNSYNLGDEAVYTALQLSCLADTKMTHFNSETTQKQQLKQYTSIMIGGGTQFTVMNIEKLRMLTQWNKNVWSFGTGVGSCGFCEPPNNNIAQLSSWLKKISPLTVRGPLSQKKLTDLGIESTITGDPALSYARSCTYKNKQHILVNLLSPIASKETKNYCTFLNNLGRNLQLYKSKGWKISFVALGPGDCRYINEFISKFDFHNSTIYEIYRCSESFLQLLGETSVLISMRLHGAILASCVGIPFLLCNYRSKCSDFTSSMHQDELLLEPMGTYESMWNSFDSAICNAQTISRSINQRALYYKDLQHNFLKKQFSYN